MEHRNCCIRTFTELASRIASLKLLSERTFASGSREDIKIWYINNERCLKTLPCHTDFVNSMTLLPNGSLLSCSQDETIKVWDIEQNVCTKTLLGHTKSVLSVI